MKEKLKLLILRLNGWEKTQNPVHQINEVFHKKLGWASIEMGFRLHFKDTFLYFLFEDKTVLPVFAMCQALHILIFINFKEIFMSAAPVGWLIFFISLIDVGSTLCILYAIKKWKGRKK